MKVLARTAIASLALAASLGPAVLALPASAQYYAPAYTSWQAAWDRNQFDRNHVVVGTVANFSPYRLTLVRRNGIEQTVDLRNGTQIFPLGATPSPGERAAMVGYWSNGTFIVNRLVLRG